MGMSKTTINLRRLLATAPRQQNQAKLIHYVATLREQLEQLAEERTPHGLSRVSKAKVNEYSEKIEAIASSIAASLPHIRISEKTLGQSPKKESPSTVEETNFPSSPGLRRRFVGASNIDDRTRESTHVDTSTPLKLDTPAKARIEKHRNLQENLTDEMVGLAQLLKESSLLMSQSLQNTEKILDSTEKAVEQSLAGTGHANVRALDIYSKSSKTTCFTWLVLFLMTCIFIMVVLLIHVT
ncbi:uncharacterized protein LOC126666839 [Mercurialis annua]|uniref:uncharacterized protein LOC126666839 n=1 Tax=Mercurialis annua TaxID=3986 RepID=UPI00215F3A4B|nr:uncharacterized protein LOC126666839 [Mercurialis annua]XP_050215673.1 uncharacterized protein LOC126666839 [Mercurialis annua]XP_050215674.1 uncharacterized protein LOC126666839 [Mercurialis annua]